jgi:hypothetical protein
MKLSYYQFIKNISAKDKDKTFIKFINYDKKHHNFTYKLGLNEDFLPFNPNGSCESGGLYFTNLQNADLWMHYGDILAYIKLCDDALYYIEPCQTKFKTNKFIITKFVDLSLENETNQTDEICKLAVKKNCYALRNVIDQTDEIIKIAIRHNGSALQFIKNQSDALCEYAIRERKNGLLLEFVQNQTNKICEIALRRDGYALIFVKNQTDKICEMAVSNNGLSLEYVRVQTDRICEMAVRENGIALQYVKNKTKKIYDLAIKNDPRAKIYI